MKHILPILFLLIVLACSCKPKQSAPRQAPFRPLQNGFGVVVQEMGIDSGPGAKLYYKGTNDQPVLVWPCIGTWGDPILYTNDVALMLADKPDEQGRMGSGNIIAVQGSGPAMDISHDILRIAVEQSHVDFRTALKACRPTRLQLQANKIEVYFAGDWWLIEPSISNLTAKVTWEQIFEIIQDVKKTGKTNKVTNTEVLYLKKDYRQ